LKTIHKVEGQAERISPDNDNIASPRTIEVRFRMEPNACSLTYSFLGIR